MENIRILKLARQKLREMQIEENNFPKYARDLEELEELIYEEEILDMIDMDSRYENLEKGMAYDEELVFSKKRMIEVYDRQASGWVWADEVDGKTAEQFRKIGYTWMPECGVARCEWEKGVK